MKKRLLEMRSASVLVSVGLLMMCAVAVGAQPARLEPEVLRFEPEAFLSDALPDTTTVERLFHSTQTVELVSIPASEAVAPRHSNPRRTLELVNMADLAERLEVDRLLLSEIRKPVPEDRSEAEGYLARLKDLAGRSDPARLVPLVNRVLDQAPIFFDWLNRDFQSQEEQIIEYYVGGARGFSFVMDNFRTAVLFTIMNRLDLASRVISELEDLY